METQTFSECAADTVTKLRLYAGRCQKLASQLERLKALKLPPEAAARALGWCAGLNSALVADSFDDAIEAVRKINEAVKR